MHDSENRMSTGPGVRSRGDNHRRNKLASKVSRNALIALAIGASGLAAVPAAEAAVSIPTYLVNQPAVTGASGITPESATVAGAIDTGGNQGTTFSLPANSTLMWGGVSSIPLINTSLTAPATQFVDGIPANDSTGVFNANGGQLNNGGLDNYSSVVFEYDPVSDFNQNGGSPGPDTSFAPEVDVPTIGGLSPVSTTIGAYPASATDATGQTPLTPGTKYYYWIIQQAGVTSGAEDVNTYNGTTVTTNPTYSCYPFSYVAATPPYNGYTTTGTITGGGVTEPQIQGPCVFYFGSSNNYYQSPNGMFTTPALGKVTFGSAKLSGKAVTVAVSNSSVMPAKGVVTLSLGGASVGTGHFSVGAKSKGTVSVHLNGKGVSAAGTGATAKVTATITTDQTLGTKSIKL
jgi:hypothetical protein